jgi:hypothetical protein
MSDPLAFFIEPEWATDALLRLPFFSPIKVAWDPCCGSGNIVRAGRRAGLDMIGSDIADRGLDGQLLLDFRKQKRMLGDADAIIFNPPYGSARLAKEFIAHARSLKPKLVAAFVENRFLASAGRYDFFMRDHRPTCIAFLSDRPSCPPGDAFLAGEIKATGGKQDYCWLIWCDWLAGAPREPVWLRRAA